MNSFLKAVTIFIAYFVFKVDANLSILKTADANLLSKGEQIRQQLSSRMSLSRSRSLQENPEMIINGDRVPKGKFNFMVSLSMGCGGTMISSTHVLTAAHCTIGESEVTVSFYNPSADSYANIDQPAEEITTSNIIIHPDYNDYTLRNDISILILPKEPNQNYYDLINYKMTPTQIANFEAPDTESVISGWGLNEFGYYPAYMRYATVYTWSTSECKTNYNNAGFSFNSLEMICANDEPGPNDDSIIDTCYGDSGGPLFVEDGSNTYQIGITSWGSDCAVPDLPGVYARVSTYITWIDSVINLSYNCMDSSNWEKKKGSFEFDSSKGGRICVAESFAWKKPNVLLHSPDLFYADSVSNVDFLWGKKLIYDDWTKLRYTSSIRVDENDASTSLYPNTGYTCVIQPFNRKNNGKSASGEIILYRGNTWLKKSSDFINLKVGKWYNLKVKAVGDEITCQLTDLATSDTISMDIMDSTFEYGTYRLSMYSSFGYVSNFEVSEGTDPVPLVEETFCTLPSIFQGWPSSNENKLKLNYDRNGKSCSARAPTIQPFPILLQTNAVDYSYNKFRSSVFFNWAENVYQDQFFSFRVNTESRKPSGYTCALVTSDFQNNGKNGKVRVDFRKDWQVLASSEKINVNINEWYQVVATANGDKLSCAIKTNSGTYKTVSVTDGTFQTGGFRISLSGSTPTYINNFQILYGEN